MTDESNPHADKSTEENKAVELAASEEAAKAAEAVAAQEAADAAVKKAEETKGDLPDPDKEKEDTPEDIASEGAEADAEGTEEEKELDTALYGDTSSDVGNSTLQLLQNAGVTPEDAKALLYDAVSKNDMSLIDKDALTKAVGEANATIILLGAKTYAAEVADNNTAIAKEVHGVVGSEANWETIQTWAETNVSDADKLELNQMIVGGGAKARFAATELMNKYNADKANTEITDTARVDGDVDTSSQSDMLTAKQAYAKLAEANRKGLDTTAIRAARARGRAKGI